jgi:uncharacterized phage protein (TIGR01671 family)
VRKYKFRAWIYNNITEQNEMCYDLASVNNLMQYTGLKDKNGKEIYEGDIVKTIEHYNNETRRRVCIGVVILGEYRNSLLGCEGFEEYGWHIYGKHIEYDLWDIVTNHKGWCEVEVIGNIYENPELLEVEK